MVEEEKFLRNSLIKFQREELYPFVILKDREITGMIDLHAIDHSNKHAEIGYWLGDKYLHQGIATQAVKMIESYAFNHLKLHKLVIQIENENHRSEGGSSTQWLYP